MPKHIFKIAMDPASKDIAGLVKLSDEINSNLNVDNSTASTPYATKQAYDKALESVDAVSKVNEKVEALTPLVNTNTESITTIIDGLGTAAYTDKTAYVPMYHASSVGKSIVPIGGQDNGFGHVNLTDIYTENDFDQTKGYAATPEALYKVYQITQEKYEDSAGKQLEENISTINETITTLNKKVSAISSTVIVYTDGGNFPVDTYKNVIMELQSDSKFTFGKSPSLYFEFNIYLTNGGNYNVVFSDSVKWSNNITPTLSKDATDVIKFITVDFGTTWYGIVLGSNL